MRLQEAGLVSIQEYGAAILVLGEQGREGTTWVGVASLTFEGCGIPASGLEVQRWLRIHACRAAL